ncbi:MAG: N-acetylornithine carbamoyltransferase [Cryomorphaceae bacterium]|nr:MAG: N-acetylornithine carbamoyltransferase [Cryomorphaceae bacterium]
MKKFIYSEDLIDYDINVSNLIKYKNNVKISNKYQNKILGLIFFNPSLRTRLSTQKAALNLGIKTISINVNKDSWQLEFEDNIVMNGDKPEHVKEAAQVISQYCDIIGVRSFASLENKKSDLEDIIINSFVKYSNVPVINLESAISHPLQSLADALTIKENSKFKNPKIILSWTPHIKPLPHAVANSFIKMCRLCNFDLTITNPKECNLSKEITNGFDVIHDQNTAFKNADFIYAKNWSSFENYGKLIKPKNSWTIDTEKMELTNNAYFMHCLPVRRNLIVMDDVLDSKNNLTINQANNRTFATQYILDKILKNEK